MGAKMGDRRPDAGAAIQACTDLSRQSGGRQDLHAMATRTR